LDPKKTFFQAYRNLRLQIPKILLNKNEAALHKKEMNLLSIEIINQALSDAKISKIAS
jgi:hypothetical protein